MDRILKLLAQAQGAYFGEPVTQLEHALQCAHLAQQAGARPTLVAAALVHDVGHLLGESPDEFGEAGHEVLGSAYLRACGLPETLVHIVAGHVPAKRYLTATDPAYHQALSAASQETLRRQGGPMSEAEVAAFRADPLFAEMVQLRLWDEAAKIPGLPVPGLEHYREMLSQLMPR
ncbi:MAG: HD domain-containing protein [Bryobacteraceae bacterium]|nr:HD domain-containing protein [Bryobacteraceae bacterium]